MKFLAWVMFLTSTACFVAVFCKQQWEAQINATTSEYSRPTDAWRLAVAITDQEDANDAGLANVVNTPATRPAMASADDMRPIAAHETVATSDLDDAVK